MYQAETYKLHIFDWCNNILKDEILNNSNCNDSPTCNPQEEKHKGKAITFESKKRIFAP